MPNWAEEKKSGSAKKKKSVLILSWNYKLRKKSIQDSEISKENFVCDFWIVNSRESSYTKYW
jgi:hypothetical protein